MANAILKSEYVSIFLFGESIIWLIFLALSILAGWLLFWWDFDSYEKEQYKRERIAWLITTAVVALSLIKVILLPYFVFTIDYLSRVVPGAMCGAGVISFNDYGVKLLYLKIAIVFVLMLWLVLNYEDLKDGKYPLFKLKISLFMILSALLSLEIFWDFKFFLAIDIHKVINCCSTLYGLLEGMNPLPYGLNQTTLLILFFILFALIITSWLGEVDILLFISLLLFFQIAYYTELYIFGTYIYQQPNHNCPFCMLQREYHYIGYLVWGSLFGGVFAGVLGLISKHLLKRENKKLFKLMVLMLSIFVLMGVSYIALYYLQNGTLLQEIDNDSMGGMMMEM